MNSSHRSLSSVAVLLAAGLGGGFAPYDAGGLDPIATLPRRPAAIPSPRLDCSSLSFHSTRRRGRAKRLASKRQRQARRRQRLSR